MDKLQQYYESLPLCTGNTPGNVMFSVYNDIDNLDSLRGGLICPMMKRIIKSLI